MSQVTVIESIETLEPASQPARLSTSVASLCTAVADTRGRRRAHAP